MPRSAIRSVLAAVALGLGAPAAAPAQPAYTIEKIAIEGDADPDGHGPMDQMIGRVDLDEDGHVVFATYVAAGGGSEQLIAVHDGVALQSALRSGDVLPGTAGLLISLGNARIRSGGALAWGGSYGPASEWGAFLREGSSDAAIALAGDAAPGGGTISRVSRLQVMNNVRDVAFHADIEVGAPDTLGALFLHRSMGLQEVVREGDPAPAPVGGKFTGTEQARRPGLAADGSLAFWSEVQGGSVPHGVFRWSPAAGIAPLLLQGSPVLTPDGGSFEFIRQQVSVNAQGELCVLALVLRPGEPVSRLGIYVVDGGGHREVVRYGDELPGTSGQTYLDHASGTPPILNAAGDVAFAARFDNASWSSGVFVSRGGVLSKVVRTGDPVPGAPGAVFGDFAEVAMNDAGQIAFFASTTMGGGIWPGGVFLATPAPPEVPLAPPLLVGVLAATLVASGLRQASGLREMPRKSRSTAESMPR